MRNRDLIGIVTTSVLLASACSHLSLSDGSKKMTSKESYEEDQEEEAGEKPGIHLLARRLTGGNYTLSAAQY